MNIYYEGITVFADSVLCAPNHIYTREYVASNIIANKEPLVFTCPGTLASTIRIAPATYYVAEGSWANAGHLRFVTLAEIEVFKNIPLYSSSGGHLSLGGVHFVQIGMRAEIKTPIQSAI